MQIYADVTGRPMKVSRSGQTCALGAAIAGAVVGGAHKNFASAQMAMTGLKSRVFHPEPASQATYAELYKIYKKLHDAFGTEGWRGNLHDVMKRLLEIRTKARA
jgi:L-ribulokinase